MDQYRNTLESVGEVREPRVPPHPVSGQRAGVVEVVPHVVVPRPDGRHCPQRLLEVTCTLQNQAIAKSEKLDYSVHLERRGRWLHCVRVGGWKKYIWVIKLTEVLFKQNIKLTVLLLRARKGGPRFTN